MNQLATDIVKGSISNEAAYSIGMKMISAGLTLFGECQYSDVSSLSRSQACEQVKKIQASVNHLELTRALFHSYPLVANAAYEILKIITIAEGTVIPVLIYGNSDADSGLRVPVTYFIRHPLTGLIKIGKTIDLDKRIVALECGSGVQLEIIHSETGDFEKEFHERFSNQRVYGEWFTDDSEVISRFIEKRKRLEV